ncbi:MAG: N-acetylneuraminate synthase [Promethearchaeota archaeon]
MKSIRIGKKTIGEGNPCFIIAEAGVNHNGSLELAKNLVDVAKNVGADAVKFQTFKPERLVTRYAKKADYQKATTLEESQHEMLMKLKLTERQFKDLKDYTTKKEIIFLSTPFDLETVEFLDKLDIPAFKIGSGDVTNIPLLEHIAKKLKPIILSTGMSNLGEIENAIETITNCNNENIILLHCVTSYPTPIEAANLMAIGTLRKAFKRLVGFSDHTLGILAPIIAISLGASVIEKHFTLDKKLKGPDHQASLEPNEFAEMVRMIRTAEKALGDGIKKLEDVEKEIKKVARRSIVARSEILPGQIISEENLDIKRPGIGLEPKHFNQVIGKKAKRKISEDELISWDLLE